MTTKPIGLYVHVPFCERRCSYCDFCSYAVSSLDSSVRERYFDALVDEILSYKREEPIAVDTVFFGGGTPSLLTVSEAEKIFAAIEKSFRVLPHAEITLEANPGTVTEEKLLAYKRLGVNRLSIGLQSIHENELKKLGRIHNFEEFLESYRLARELGYDNIGIDLMYGIPEQTSESLRETLDTVASLSPEHISAYGLIVEEGTQFFRERDTLMLPDEDTECDMYELTVSRLSELGYSHYEISNYAKEGRESRHNLHYWRAEEYIGVGVSAHSYFGGERYFNTDSIYEYSTGAAREVEACDVELEYAMLRLRLAEGFSLDGYERRFSRSFTEGREEKLRHLERLGYLRREGGRVALTDRGMYVSNAILSDLL